MNLPILKERRRKSLVVTSRPGAVGCQPLRKNLHGLRKGDWRRPKSRKNSSKTTKKKKPGHWRRVRLFGMFWGVGGKRWREKCGERVNWVVTDLKIEGMKWKSTGGMPPSLREFGGWWNITILCGGFKKSKPSWHIFFTRVAEAAPRWNSSFRKRKWRTAKKCLKASTTTGRRSLSSYDVVWRCLMKSTKGNDSLIMTVQCCLQGKD